jgi:hypothetical protein
MCLVDMKNYLLFVVATASLTVASVAAFSPTCSQQRQTRQCNTQLAFGIPKFLTPQDPDDTKVEQEKKIGIGGLIQLITAGAGAPFLGNFEGVDKETGKFMFSLEANNLMDENGNSKQTSMPYFENGWVDENEEQNFKWPWEKK